MSLRPGTLCKLEKGRLIDSQKGFVDTFNWMVDFIENLKGDGERIEVDRSMSDAPVVRLVEDDEKTSGGTEYVAGEDTNIVFTPKEDGSVAVDVYYK